MPSWPSRFLSSSSATPSPTTISVNERPISPRTRADALRSTGTSARFIPPLASIELSSSSDSASRPRHGRSISHPFPSLFGNGKRTDRKVDLDQLEAELDGLNDDTGIIAGKEITRTSSEKEKSQPNENDLVVGKCATCDSLVRWPRHLDVYRCSVCLMINDLKHAIKQTAGARLDHSLKKADSGNRIPRKVLPLSVERTRKLVDECVIKYLRSRLEHLRHQHHLGENSNSGMRTRSAPSIMKPDCAEADSTERKPVSPTSPHSVVVHIKEGNERRANRYENLGVKNPLESLGSSDPFKMDRVEVLPRMSATRARASSTVPEQSHYSVPAANHLKESSLPPAKYIFRPLETYLTACLNDCDCLNASFSSFRPSVPVRAASETSASSERPTRSDLLDESDLNIYGMDAKTLLLGDFAENGMWWTGDRHLSHKKVAKDHDGANNLRDQRKPYVDWKSLQDWYSTIFSCGMTWKSQWRSFCHAGDHIDEVSIEEQEIEESLAQARLHVQRTFLKTVENLLRRPGRPLKSLEHCRFLLILLANPLLYPQSNIETHTTPWSRESGRGTIPTLKSCLKPTLPSQDVARHQDNDARGGATGHHSGIVKRILGLIANVPSECHQNLVLWFCRYSETQFQALVELVGGFVSYRLSRQRERKLSNSYTPTSELIPEISGLGAGASAHLHAALTPTGTPKQSESKTSAVGYAEDWQIKAAARVMSLLFTANNSGRFSRFQKTGALDSGPVGASLAAQQRAQNHAQLLPTSAFYNTLLDYADLIADFEAWESRRGKFSFCQYPMFLSIWAKIHIMEHDARRQMEVKAREAFFNSILSRKAVSQYLQLKVRRDCLVDDSLRAVSEVVGTGQEEIKKSLRIEFVGEEGVDAGGLRKEWFLLLVREVFDPEHGLFTYDEESHYCYFNPNSLETSDQFFLVGVVFGLAIYNSTILDVALPPFAFRKLLASAPAYTGPTTSSLRTSGGYTLEDLAAWKPSLARGLQQLLDFEGDVEETFCRDFVADVDRYGQIVQVPLCTNGEKRTVTNSNRREFVDLYIHYLMDIAVAKQYEPFKRGFFTVCGGNALSLFRPEEIELLVRGSDEPLDVSSLRAVATYENWKSTPRGEEDPTVTWFWEAFAEADVKSQRKILGFITGSDRIPAMGATSLTIKMVCMGDNYERFPTARTCFNMLGLYRYRSYAELKGKLWRAVLESEGFGLK